MPRTRATFAIPRSGRGGGSLSEMIRWASTGPLLDGQPDPCTRAEWEHIRVEAWTFHLAEAEGQLSFGLRPPWGAEEYDPDPVAAIAAEEPELAERYLALQAFHERVGMTYGAAAWDAETRTYDFAGK